MRRAHGAVALAIVAILAVAPIGATGLHLYADTRESVDSRCWFEGPPQGVTISENALVRADATFIPVGRTCAWNTPDGSTITTQTGWGWTLGAWLSTAVLAVAGFMAFSRGGRRVRDVAAGAVTAGVLLWALILWTAAAI